MDRIAMVGYIAVILLLSIMVIGHSDNPSYKITLVGDICIGVMVSILLFSSIKIEIEDRGN